MQELAGAVAAQGSLFPDNRRELFTHPYQSLGLLRIQLVTQKKVSWLRTSASSPILHF